MTVVAEAERAESHVAPRRRFHLLRFLRVHHALATFVAFVVLGNASIMGMSVLTQAVAPATSVPFDVDGVSNLTMVDQKVWRGAAPTLDGYRSLAAAGVTTVVDLRAEDDAAENDALIDAYGIDVVHLPIRDGQLPSDLQIARFHMIVREAEGTVFLHCGAGVGRTGAMAGAYLVAEGHDPKVVLARNLAVGPPSLEQIAFVMGLDGDGDADRPSAPIVAISRVLDAPRRLWTSLG